MEHARHQAAHRVLVEEPRLQPQEVIEDRLAQIVDHALAGELHQVTFQRSERVEDREHCDVEPTDPCQTDPVRSQDVLVDGDLQEPRLGELDDGDQGKEGQ